PTYAIAMVLYKKGEVEKAKIFLEKQFKKKKEIIYYLCLTLFDLILADKASAEKKIIKGLKLIETKPPDISTQTDSFLNISQCYYEIEDFKDSLDFSKKVTKLTHPQGREHNIASAFMKINEFNLKKEKDLDINEELSRLKEIGCIYDYAYLGKLRIESLMRSDLKQEQIQEIAEELNGIKEIFESLGAGLELDRTKKLQARLFPIILKDYSRRVISVQYLDTFSKLAELISSDLGNEDFAQHILDLVVKTTNAERGALFMKTPKGLEFIAGRDIDQTTIKDAGELSHTAIQDS
ncbi:unnamed protein product, partial [marine sediment metagenome]